MHFAAGNVQTQSAHNLLIADGDAQIFYSQFLHKLEPQIYASSGDFANGAGNFSVFPVIRFALRIWIYGGSFFPPFRYSNIIGNTVALLSRLFEILSSKEVAEERRRSIRYADDLVRRLTIEFEIELGLGPVIVPVGKRFELTSSQAPLCARNASDGDAHTRRLPGDAPFFCDRLGRDDDPVRDKTRSPFILAREDEDPIALGDVPATIHRLLRAEGEPLRRWVINLGFDREDHFPSMCESERQKKL